MTSGYCVNTIKYSVNFGVIRYVAPMGDNVLDASATTARVPIAENTVKKLFVKCTSFGLNAPMTVTLFKNGVATTLTVTVTGVGTFTATEDVSLSDGDDLCYEVSSEDSTGGTAAVIRIVTCFLVP